MPERPEGRAGLLCDTFRDRGLNCLAIEGQPLRTYEMDLEEGKPRALGPSDFTGVAVAKDGKKIAGRNSSAEAVVFDLEIQKLQVIPGVERWEILAKWTEDGQGRR